MQTTFPGSEPMARIDGDKIRRLRESKGLTQLYLATVVGVTTDTVSRWENRRYPTIKRDNALKLAEALEVEIETILEDRGEEEPGTVPGPEALEAEVAGEEKVARAGRRGPKQRLVPLLLVAFLLLPALFYWWRLADRPEGVGPAITAFRELPPHAPPGRPFPVLLTVTAAGDESFPLILKDTLPPDGAVLGSQPEITSRDGRSNEIKWIGRTTGPTTTFAYMVGTSAEAMVGRQLTFTGTVTLKEQGNGKGDIQGDSVMVLDTFHWADVNGDNRIDDTEILTVYDRYSDIPGLDFDQDRIDEIWAARGYRWDTAAGDFVVIP